jgi:metal-dependent amidase/aminoacylase/carboxypeptidase family protein
MEPEKEHASDDDDVTKVERIIHDNPETGARVEEVTIEKTIKGSDRVRVRNIAT